MLDWLLDVMRGHLEATAVVWKGRGVTYGELLAKMDSCRRLLDDQEVGKGQVVALLGDFSPTTIALLLALFSRQAVVVPLTESVLTEWDDLMRIAEVQVVARIDAADQCRLEVRGGEVTNVLTRRLLGSGGAGLVLFTSGTTGTSKAALHDVSALLEKFKVRRQPLITITFLLLDHIGGINTLLYALSNGGTVVSIRSRGPEEVCRAVERHGVELLPTTPTFLNLMLMSGAVDRHDLRSLKRVSYGTEVMPEATLRRLREALPSVDLVQTYGLTELGILRSKSKEPGSLYLRVGGEGFETKVVDGILFVRAKSAMLGYLNAPSPFDDDGWFNTQDAVEIDGDFIRILGRRTEIINVGGQKVYPAEVESVVMQMDNVRDVAVHGEANPVTGHIVVARVNVDTPEDPAELKRRVRAFCRERLAPYKVPVRVEVADHEQYGARYKKKRGPRATEAP